MVFFLNVPLQAMSGYNYTLMMHEIRTTWAIKCLVNAFKAGLAINVTPNVNNQRYFHYQRNNK